MAKVSVTLARSQMKLVAESLNQAREALSEAGFNGRTHERLSKIVDTVQSAIDNGTADGGEDD